MRSIEELRKNLKILETEIVDFEIIYMEFLMRVLKLYGFTHSNVWVNIETQWGFSGMTEMMVQFPYTDYFISEVQKVLRPFLPVNYEAKETVDRFSLRVDMRYFKKLEPLLDLDDDALKLWARLN